MPLSITLTGPDGLPIGPINSTVSSQGIWQVMMKNATHYYHYYLSYQSNNSRGTAKTYLYLLLNQNSSINATTIGVPLDSGPWTIDINNEGASPQEVNEYVYSASGDELFFSGIPGAYFLNPNENHTISAPATADHAIVVGSHVLTHVNPSAIGNLSVFSSLGQRLDGRNFSLITAPGESVTSTCSRTAQGSSGNYTTMKGTSQATPMVAGAIALAIQNNSAISDNLTHLVSCLLSSSRIDGNVTSFGSSPNYAFGYGKLNISEFIRLTSQYQHTIPSVDPPGDILLSSPDAGNPDADGQYQLAWNISSDADNYSLFVFNKPISAINGSLTLLSDGVLNHSYEIHGATNGILYYKIVAYNGTGETLSNTLTIRVF